MSTEGGSSGNDEALGDKTEDATPRRQEQARERGQIPKSQEFSTAVTLTGGLLLLATVGGPWSAAVVVRIWGRSGELAVAPPGTLADATTYVREVLLDVGRALSLPLLGLSAIILLFNAFQARGTWAPKQLEWKLEKLNPIKGLEKLLKWTTLVELLKAALKFVVLGTALWLAIRTMWPTWFGLTDSGVQDIPAAMRDGTLRLVVFVVALFGALAALDYAWQIFQYKKQLRMSLYEVKKETKEDQGDPVIRAWRRRFAQAQLRRIMLQSVKNADVLVTNPTHIAIALKLDESIETPVILAMGTDRLAERFKKLAREAGVPIVEERPLARALLEVGRVGEPIPAALYQAVGEVLAYVYRTTGRLPEWLKRRLTTEEKPRS